MITGTNSIGGNCDLSININAMHKISSKAITNLRWKHWCFNIYFYHKPDSNYLCSVTSGEKHNIMLKLL